MSAWETIGNVANTSGVAGAVFVGASTIVSGYQAYASPYTTLTESMKRLELIRSRIQGISAQRRRKIESAAEKGTCKSLADLEEQLEDLWDFHCRLSKRYEESSYIQRHLPKTQLRESITSLENEVKMLLLDTWATTVPFIDNIEFGTPKRPGRPSHDTPTGSGSPRSTNAHHIRLTVV